jgi:hypothetical protein
VALLAQGIRLVAARPEGPPADRIPGWQLVGINLADDNAG